MVPRACSPAACYLALLRKLRKSARPSPRACARPGALQGPETRPWTLVHVGQRPRLTSQTLSPGAEDTAMWGQEVAPPAFPPPRRPQCARRDMRHATRDVRRAVPAPGHGRERPRPAPPAPGPLAGRGRAERDTRHRASRLVYGLWGATVTPCPGPPPAQCVWTPRPSSTVVQKVASGPPWGWNGQGFEGLPPSHCFCPAESGTDALWHPGPGVGAGGGRWLPCSAHGSLCSGRAFVTAF